MATVVGDKNCTRCNLHSSAQSVCLMGRGPIPCDVMIVGEAPGFREDDIGKPFQGPAGKMLEEALEKAGWSRDEVYITNMVRCRPPDNRTPRITEIRACSDWMQKEIRLVKPKYVLLLGRIAARLIPGSKAKKLSDIQGKPIEINGIYYFVSFHPGACLPYRDKRGFKKSQFEIELLHFFRIVKNQGPLEETGLNKRVVTSIEKFNEFVTELNANEIVSLDLETMGLNPWEKDKHIVLMGIGLEQTQWCIPLWTEHTIYHRKNPFKTEKSRKMVVKLVAEILQDKKVVVQFGKFDYKWLRREYHVKIPIWVDTGILHAVLDENSPHDLVYLASKYFSASNYDIPVEQKQGYDISLKKHTEYLARDLFYTRKCIFPLLDELKEDPRLEKFFWEIPMKAYRLYAKAEYNGLYVNKNQLANTMQHVGEGLGNAYQRLNLIAESKGKSILWSSHKQIREFFYDDLNLPVLGLTKGGKPSTDESTLKALANLPKKKEHRLKISEIATREKHNPRIFDPGTEIVWFEGHIQDIPKFLLQYREATKLNEFIDSWESRLDDRNRLHVSYKMQTVTGRPSCSEPNIQQTPRNPIIRSAIDAPEGWTLVAGDYSQIELRLVAMHSQDPEMLSVFQLGGDIHVHTAQSVLGAVEVSEDVRKKTKAVNFGFIYGMGWRKFVKYAKDKYEVDFSDSEAKRFRNSFFERYKAVPKWHNKQRRIAKYNGYVRNLAGRVRHLPNIYSDDEGLVAQAERQAINSVIQGFGSDIALAAAIEIDETFSYTEVRVLATVHDELLMWVKNSCLNTHIPRIKEIMENPKIITEELGVTFTVPITVELKVGPWGKGAKWEQHSI